MKRVIHRVSLLPRLWRRVAAVLLMLLIAHQVLMASPRDERAGPHHGRRSAATLQSRPEQEVAPRSRHYPRASCSRDVSLRAS